MVGLYGKVYHLWQTDRGDKLPMGQPQLMTSYTEEKQMNMEAVKDRDKRFGVDSEKKKKGREYIEVPEIHNGRCLRVPLFYGRGTNWLADADQAWKTG